MGAVCLMRTLNQLARCVQGKGGGGDFVVIPLRAQSSRPLIVYSMVGTTDYNKRDTMSQPNRRCRHSARSRSSSLRWLQRWRRCRVYLLSFPYSALGRSSVQVEEERGPAIVPAILLLTMSIGILFSMSCFCRRLLFICST